MLKMLQIFQHIRHFLFQQIQSVESQQRNVQNGKMAPQQRRDFREKQQRKEEFGLYFEKFIADANKTAGRGNTARPNANDKDAHGPQVTVTDETEAKANIRLLPLQLNQVQITT